MSSACQERRRGERLSRHWHDLARLDEAGIAAAALTDRSVALSGCPPQGHVLSGKTMSVANGSTMRLRSPVPCN